MSAGEYLLAAGAAANSIFTALEIGWKTILAWGCTTQFAPFFMGASPLGSVRHCWCKTFYFVMTRGTTGDMRVACRNDDNSTALPANEMALQRNSPPAQQRGSCLCKARKTRAQKQSKSPSSRSLVGYWDWNRRRCAFCLRLSGFLVAIVRDGS